MIDGIIWMIIFAVLLFGAFTLGFVTGYMRPWEEDENDIQNDD